MGILQASAVVHVRKGSSQEQWTSHVVAGQAHIRRNSGCSDPRLLIAGNRGPFHPLDLVSTLESALISPRIVHPGFLRPVPRDVDFISWSEELKEHEQEIVDDHTETKELSSPDAAPIVPLQTINK